MSEAFIVPLLVIGGLELSDKTRLVALILTTRYNAPFQIFLGMTLAYALVDGITVVFGTLIASLLPLQVIKYAAASLSIVFGLALLFLLKEEDEERKLGTGMPMVAAFLASLTELGDKTQIAVGLFSVQYQSPLLVFAGAMSALAVLNLV